MEHTNKSYGADLNYFSNVYSIILHSCYKATLLQCFATAILHCRQPVLNWYHNIQADFGGV